jgi:tetratricopeptide (TPR) repeat protein
MVYFKALFVLLVWLAVASCATTPPTAPAPVQLFHDELFGEPSERIDPRDVFAMSAEMTRYLDQHIARQARVSGSRQALYDALYTKQQLQLEYDSTTTRNAAQAFDARAGNCLSLVIMTAAFARELGIPVRYQVARIDDAWTHAGDIEFFSGHVNLALARILSDMSWGIHDAERMTIDFLSPGQVRGLRTREVAEETIAAMYMNNKAAEALAQRRVDDAYWWARAAIERDPGFNAAYNTLGVVYQRHGDLAPAERALAYALERDPSNAHAMSNLVTLLRSQGRAADAQAMSERLRRLEPDPPFAFYRRGVAAMREQRFDEARALFAKEVDRAPYHDELRYWLAAAHAALGQADEARKQLDLAIEYTTSKSHRDIYAAKLAKIRSPSPQH